MLGGPFTRFSAVREDFDPALASARDRALLRHMLRPPFVDDALADARATPRRSEPTTRLSAPARSFVDSLHP
jgi:hypothetical protein